MPDATRDDRIRRHGPGFLIEGPCFVVWDEDRNRALDAARSLRSAAPRSRPRSLRRAGARFTGAPDAEALDR